MGRYSSDGYSSKGEMVDELQNLMEDTSDVRVRKELQEFIAKIESM